MSNASQHRANFSLIRELHHRFLNLPLPGAAPVASGVVTISGSGTLTTIVTVNGTAVSTAWATSNAATATAVAAALNANTTVNKLITATANSANVYLVANLPGAFGATITVVVSGTAASTYNYATAGTLLGGITAGTPISPTSILTLTSASGTVGVIINGTTVTVTASGGDAATAQALVTAINTSTASTDVVATFGGTNALATNSTVYLQPTAAFVGYTTQLVTVGTTVTVDRSYLGPNDIGMGISEAYQLNPGYYMVTFTDQYPEMVAFYRDFLAPTVPAADFAWMLSEQPLAVGSGYLLLSGMSATDAFQLQGNTFTCVASDASTNQFNVGSHDSDTAINIAAVVNTTLGSAGITATAVALASNGGAVIFTSTIGAMGFNATGSHGHAASFPTVAAVQATDTITFSGTTGTLTATLALPGLLASTAVSVNALISFDSKNAMAMANAINASSAGKYFRAGALGTTVTLTCTAFTARTAASGNAGTLSVSGTGITAGNAAFTGGINGATGALAAGSSVFIVTLPHGGTGPIDNSSQTNFKAAFTFRKT